MTADLYYNIDGHGGKRRTDLPGIKARPWVPLHRVIHLTRMAARVLGKSLQNCARSDHI